MLDVKPEFKDFCQNLISLGPQQLDPRSNVQGDSALKLWDVEDYEVSMALPDWLEYYEDQSQDKNKIYPGAVYTAEGIQGVITLDYKLNCDYFREKQREVGWTLQSYRESVGLKII